ncbi:enoyl-CoA hydratase-related protein [Pigmentiphaga soli]|uniref:Enoyl-CoA hydratase-related protein n=1 Tax=Pigmentiphaga soli TaxID=1007095 RepID=A0ABP8GT55_9BURK
MTAPEPASRPWPPAAAFTQIDGRLDDDGVLSLALARPAKQNAIGIEMTGELEQALEAIAADGAVRVVVLRAQGPHFCAGMDLRDFFAEGQRPPEQVAGARRAVERLRRGQLRELPQPVVAAVRGHCLGAAITLVESADIAIAADDAVFGFPEINFGFFFGGPIAKAALALMPRRAAAYYGLTGETFGAAEALRLGVITRSVAAAALDDETMRVARRLAGKQPDALRLSKESLRAVGGLDWEAAIRHGAHAAARLADAQAGPQARTARVRQFMEGRFKPGRDAPPPE